MNPKSPPPPPPPGRFDSFGKRRQMLKVQVLEREIGLLQEELKSLEGLQPSSRSCKELETFVVAKPDPFITTNQKMHKSHRSWSRFGVNLPWIFCCSGCAIRLEIPKCCTGCKSCNFQWPRCSCSKKKSCQKFCNFLDSSCRPTCCCCFKMYKLS